MKVIWVGRTRGGAEEGYEAGDGIHRERQRLECAEVDESARRLAAG